MIEPRRTLDQYDFHRQDRADEDRPQLPRRNTAEPQRRILLIENSSRSVSTIAGLTLATTAFLLIRPLRLNVFGRLPGGAALHRVQISGSGETTRSRCHLRRRKVTPILITSSRRKKRGRRKRKERHLERDVYDWWETRRRKR